MKPRHLDIGDHVVHCTNNTAKHPDFVDLPGLVTCKNCRRILKEHPLRFVLAALSRGRHDIAKGVARFYAPFEPYEKIIALADLRRQAAVTEAERARNNLDAIRSSLGYWDDRCPLEYLDLTVRANNVLEGAGLRTVGAVCEKTAGDILRIKNSGRKVLDQLVERLDAGGRALAPS